MDVKGNQKEHRNPFSGVPTFGDTHNWGARVLIPCEKLSLWATSRPKGGKAWGLLGTTKISGLCRRSKEARRNSNSALRNGAWASMPTSGAKQNPAQGFVCVSSNTPGQPGDDKILQTRLLAPKRLTSSQGSGLASEGELTSRNHRCPILGEK